MPHYELTLIVRSLPKHDLINVLKKSMTTLLDHGAVITKCENLGHRDLPYAMKQKKERLEYSGSYFLMDVHTKRGPLIELAKSFVREPLILRSHFSKIEPEAEPTECTLGTELLPPAQRPSVTGLRPKQKMSRYERVRAWKRAQFEYRLTPKSFTIGPLAE